MNRVVRNRYKKYMVDILVSIPKKTIANWKKAKHIASCKSMHQKNKAIESNELEINQNATSFESDELESEELFSGLCSNYSAEDRVDCESRGEGGTLDNEITTENGTSGQNYDTCDSQFDDYINNDKWKSPLFNGSKVNLLHVIIMIGTFVARYSLTKDALQHLLDILGLLLPKDSLLPPTTYLFNKCLPESQIETKYFCPSCNDPLIEENDIFICPCAQQEHTKSQLVLKGCFYLYMSVADQLRCILESFGLGKHIKCIDGKNKSAPLISDVYDGKIYSQFCDRRKGQYAISLMGSTDGVVSFKTTSTSLWPVHFIILELPPTERKKYPIVSSLWFAKGKPNCSALLRGFCEEIKELSNSGFKWKRSNEEVVTSTVDLLGFCCDAVARAPVQNFLQFNGYFGCSWCEHSGLRVENRTVYNYTENETKRTKRSVEQCAFEANQFKHSVKGVKGFSILSIILSSFDIIRGIVFDSMHCIDLGVMKQLVTLWFDSKNSSQPWYIASFITQINLKLSKIIPPSNVSRLPGSLSLRSTWKSSEWRNLLIYYGPFILKGFLPEEFYNHFLLLSSSIYLLNQKSITLEEFFSAKKNLEIFVKDFERLYGVVNMTFNVHQLLHACDCVQNWGPLWVTSAYGFENTNGVLVEMFNGTQCMNLQIAQNFQKFMKLKALTSLINNSDIKNADFDEIQKKIIGTNINTKKIVRHGNDIVFIGKGKLQLLSPEQKNSCKNYANASYLSFNRMIIKNTIYTISSYKKDAKRSNCFISDSKGRIIQITSFGILQSNIPNQPNIPRIFGVLVEVDNFSFFPNKKQLLQIKKTGDLISIHPYCVVSKCIVLNSQTGVFLSELCNLLDRD